MSKASYKVTSEFEFNDENEEAALKIVFRFIAAIIVIIVLVIVYIKLNETIPL